ncbi:MAG TPA: phytoene/squalene synthase family protein [Chlorobiota bacterium]|nr:phytoene/squalene synthase family protein [Chlorobiota bacterium]
MTGGQVTTFPAVRVCGHVDTTVAYEECRNLTFRHAKTFYFASRFLPRTKRNACYAVYAFCRWVDDLVDVATQTGNVTPADAAVLVHRWRTRINNLYDGKGPEDLGGFEEQAILTAWDDTLRRFDIPRNLPEELIEGVLLDTVVDRFATFDELKNYCYKVASVVGLMTTPIFGYNDDAALPRAVDLGIAMQLTNIIRDVGEDAAMGRIYLPQEELRAFGVSEDDILQRRMTPGLRALLEFQTARARSYYHQAESGISLLDGNARPTVRLMSRNYEKILDVVEKMDYDVFRRRASTTLFQKLCSIPSAFFGARHL